MADVNLSFSIDTNAADGAINKHLAKLQQLNQTITPKVNAKDLQDAKKLMEGLLTDREKIMANSSRAEARIETHHMRGLLGKGAEGDAMRNRLLAKNQADTSKMLSELKGADPFGEMASSVATFGQNLAGIAGPAGAILAAIGLIKSAWDDVISQQEKARQTQMTYGDALAGTIVNLGTDDKITNAKILEERLATVSKDTGVSPKDVAIMAGDAFSARGNLSADEALAAVNASATAFRHDPATAKAASGAILDIMKVDRANGGMATPESIMGMAMQTMTESRITNPRMFFENSLPAVTAEMNEGTNARDAMAHVAALAQGGVDVTGAQSGTGYMALGKHLRTFMPEMNGKSITEMIDKIKTDPKLRDTFMDGGTRADGSKWAGASFEKRMESPIKRLLTAGSDVDKNAVAAASRIPDIDKGLPVFKAREDFKKGAAAISEADKDRRVTAETDLANIANTRAGREAGIRNEVSKTLEATGGTLSEYIGRKTAEFDLGLSTFAGNDVNAASQREIKAAIAEKTSQVISASANSPFSMKAATYLSPDITGGMQERYLKDNSAALAKEAEKNEDLRIKKKQLEVLESLLKRAEADAAKEDAKKPVPRVGAR